MAAGQHPSNLPIECRARPRENVPSNLLDEVTDESSALAEVALGAAHARLADAGGGLLYSGEKQT